MTTEIDTSNTEREYFIISEVYDGDSEAFELQLDQALDLNFNIIIIEPSKLGDETTRWIAVGDWIHKTAVVTGLGSLIFGSFCPKKPLLYFSLELLSLFSVGLYTISWQLDPCCKYKVLPTHQFTYIMNKYNINKKQLLSTNPTILIRKSITKKILLHSIICTSALGICIYRLL